MVESGKLVQPFTIVMTFAPWDMAITANGGRDRNNEKANQTVSETVNQTVSETVRVSLVSNFETAHIFGQDATFKYLPTETFGCNRVFKKCYSGDNA
jgi:hypothetical protein